METKRRQFRGPLILLPALPLLAALLGLACTGPRPRRVHVEPEPTAPAEPEMPPHPPPPEPAEAAGPDPADLAPFALSGKATIEGQAFVTDQGGRLRYAANCDVHLIPAVPFFEALFDGEMGAFKEKRDLDFAPLVAGSAPWSKVAVGDRDGWFSFPGLPAGRYILCSEVAWRAAGRDNRVWAYAKVTLREGDGLRVVVTR